MTAFISVNSPSERGPGTQSEQEKAPTIFVTVGSTRFDALIAAVLDRSFLRLLASSSLSSSSPPHLKIQYGASDLTSILLSSAIAQQDEGSALQYEPGLRVVGGERIYSHKNKKLDPGMTGTICLRLRAAPGAPRTVQSDSETIPPSKEDLDLDLGLDDAQDDEPFVPQPLEASSMGDGVLEGTTEEGVHLELFQYAPSLTDHMRASDVVICHAGSGTILEALRLEPTPPALIVVPNTSLMDNHQVELADALADRKYVIKGELNSLGSQISPLLARVRARPAVVETASTSSTSSTIPSSSPSSLRRFPPFDPSRFRALVDEEMGFAADE